MQTSHKEDDRPNPPIKRVPEIEAGMMTAELELDGLKTHIMMRGEKCPLYFTDVGLKIRKALTGVRSARDLFRGQMNTKQWTLTTRGGANRHGLWHCQVEKTWKCPFCDAKPTDCEECFKPMTTEDPIDPITFECESCGRTYCVKYLIDHKGYMPPKDSSFYDYALKVNGSS